MNKTCYEGHRNESASEEEFISSSLLLVGGGATKSGDLRVAQFTVSTDGLRGCSYPAGDVPEGAGRFPRHPVVRVLQRGPAARSGSA